MTKSRYNIPKFEDDFASVVDSIRHTGIITALSNDGKLTTLTTDNTLRVGEIIAINSKDYAVKSATLLDVVVKGVILAATEWKALAPYFMDGHMLDIADRLTKEGSGVGIYKYKKYPLIVLAQDISYPSTDIGVKTPSVTVYIANLTDPNYIPPQRRDHNFYPILDPLYSELMNAIDSSTIMVMLDQGIPTPRYYWGSKLNNKHPVNDPLDAIEIEDLKLELITKC